MHKPDIILLHGALGAADQFEPYTAGLSEKYRMHRFDFEGHGGRAESGRAFRIEHFIENLVEKLDEWKLATANVFGYSMGGYVALALAAREPERLGRVATLGTKFLWTSEYAAQEIGKLNPETIEAKVPQFARMLEARHTGIGWRTVLDKTAEMMETLGKENVLTLKTLGRVQNPVRVMVGDRDATVGVDESESVCRAMKRGELVVLADTSHPIERVRADAIIEACGWLGEGQ